MELTNISPLDLEAVIDQFSDATDREQEVMLLSYFRRIRRGNFDWRTAAFIGVFTAFRGGSGAYSKEKKEKAAAKVIQFSRS